MPYSYSGVRAHCTIFPSTPLFRSELTDPIGDARDVIRWRQCHGPLAEVDHARCKRIFDRAGDLAPEQVEQVLQVRRHLARGAELLEDRKSTRLNSSHANISYAVFIFRCARTLYHLSLYSALPI